MPVPTIYIPDDAAIRRMKAGGSTSPAAPMRAVKLGRIRPKSRKRTLRFAKYFRAAGAVPPPASADWFSKALPAIQRVYLNDTYGDCVIAGKMHQLGVWSGNDADAGGLVLATDQEVYQQYQSICGPGDNGCVITDVLDHFQNAGLKAGGKSYTIDGYVSVDWTNKLEVQVALYLFGSLTIGINLPDAWTQGGDGSTWDVTNTPIVGGHDVCCVGYNNQGVQIATWGGLRTITWAAFTSTRWIEECYAQLAPLWYGNSKLAPSGVNAEALKADLAALGGGTIPPIDPAPVPPAPVPPAPPVPPVPPAPPVILPPHYMGTASGQLPVGPFGRMVAVTLNVDLAPVSPTRDFGELESAVASALAGSSVRRALAPHVGSANWPALLVKIIAAIAPVLVADLAAGKTVEQMAADIVSAILAALAPTA